MLARPFSFALYALAFGGSLAIGSEALAITATPADYETVVTTLKPGDVLDLAPGTYPSGLAVTNLNGTAAMPITIEGPADHSAVFVASACCNTVEITNSSFVVVKNLHIDGQGLDGVFGVSAKGTGNVVHDITIEGCEFVGQNASQQTDAISTKVPTYGWIIRHNHIDGAGTGLYLGNSDGSDPFVEGLIEENLIENTIGYDAEIKYQNAWPDGAGLPTNPTATVIRNNVFIKNDDPSPDGDRPNLLVGGFPESGPGATNLTEVYGNLFFHNPRESLLQASGRITIHDNLFVDASVHAIYLTNQDLALRSAHVYDNTFYGGADAVYFNDAAELDDFVVANLVFSGADVVGPVAVAHDNLLFDPSVAPTIVAAPSDTLGQMDFYPLAGQAQGAALDFTAVANELDHDKDFNGTGRGSFTFRGAYAGDGVNPGWKPVDGFKSVGAMSGSGGAGGSSGETGSTGAGSSVPMSTGANGGDYHAPVHDGCSCRTVDGGDEEGAGLAAFGFIAGAVATRRRARFSRRSSAR